MSVTMRDVAKKSGFSLGTVDRVINNRGNVKQATVLRINEVIKELGYESNELARGLVKRRKPTIVGVVINCPEVNFYASELKRGIDDAAKKYSNYGVTVKCFLINRINENNLKETLEHILSDEKIDLLILKPVNTKSIQTVINKFGENNIPVITCASDILNTSRTCFIGHDNTRAGRIAASLMTKMIPSKSNILIITGNIDILGHRNATNGFCSYISEYMPNIKILGIMELYNSSVTIKEILDFYLKNDTIDGLCVQSIGTKGLEQISNYYKDSQRPKICTFGCGDKLKELLCQHKIDFAVFENPYKQGYCAIKTAYNILINNNVPIDSIIQVDTKIVIDESI